MAMKFHFTDKQQGLLKEYYYNRGITSRNSGIIHQIGFESHPEQSFYMQKADLGVDELLVVHMPCVDVSSLLIHANT